MRSPIASFWFQFSFVILRVLSLWLKLVLIFSVSARLRGSFGFCLWLRYVVLLGMRFWRHFHIYTDAPVIWELLISLARYDLPEIFHSIPRERLGQEISSVRIFLPEQFDRSTAQHKDAVAPVFSLETHRMFVRLIDPKLNGGLQCVFFPIGCGLNVCTGEWVSLSWPDGHAAPRRRSGSLRTVPAIFHTMWAAGPRDEEASVGAQNWYGDVLRPLPDIGFCSSSSALPLSGLPFSSIFLL